MLTDLLSTILQELGRTNLLSLANMRVDKNNSCLIKLRNDLQVQIELDSDGENLLIGCDLGYVTPGHYRQSVFCEALKSNGLPPPHTGIFAYSTKSEHLILYHKMTTKNLTGEKVADVLASFADKALTWSKAISTNEVPIVSNIRTSRVAGMFGLRP